MKLSSIFLLLFFLPCLVFSQHIIGKWYSIDAESQKKESIIEIYEKDNKINAKIVSIINEADRKRVCDKCTGINRNKPILGLVILNGLTKDGDQWNNGEILDPKNGKYYKCYIALVDDHKLKIRGYIGFSIIGRTEYWFRHLD